MRIVLRALVRLAGVLIATVAFFVIASGVILLVRGWSAPLGIAGVVSGTLLGFLSSVLLIR